MSLMYASKAPGTSSGEMMFAFTAAPSGRPSSLRRTLSDAAPMCAGGGVAGSKPHSPAVGSSTLTSPSGGGKIHLMREGEEGGRVGRGMKARARARGARDEGR